MKILNVWRRQIRKNKLRLINDNKYLSNTYLPNA